MNNSGTTGSCLCGGVEFQVTGNMGIFQYCHCSRCRKFTGSAHASNLFVSPDQFNWLKGEESVVNFLPEETKYFATAFCKKCGSSLPWKSKGKEVIIVSAGTLDKSPGIEPIQNIFFDSKADWYKAPGELPTYDRLPVPEHSS